MQLEEDDIREFRELWEKEFHETLTHGAAQARASILLELYALLVKVPPEDGRPHNPLP